MHPESLFDIPGGQEDQCVLAGCPGSEHPACGSQGARGAAPSLGEICCQSPAPHGLLGPPTSSVPLWLMARGLSSLSPQPCISRPHSWAPEAGLVRNHLMSSTPRAFHCHCPFPTTQQKRLEKQTPERWLLSQSYSALSLEKTPFLSRKANES